jgi:hypothetical protein
MDYLIFDLETNGLLADIKEDTLLQPGVNDLELKRLSLKRNSKLK